MYLTFLCNSCITNSDKNHRIIKYKTKMQKANLLLILTICGFLSASAQTATKMEAESAIYENCKFIENAKYSDGKALEVTEGNAKITFTYTATDRGKYNITVGYDGLYGDKVVNLTVNGGTVTFNTTEKGLGEVVVGPYLMNQGDNTIEITPNWTWFRIDYITITIEDDDSDIIKCATPEISYDNGKLEFACETEGVEFVSEVTVKDAKKYYDASVTLSQTYKVTVYATKAGYENSDIATREIVITGNGKAIVVGDVDGDGKVNVADHVKLSDIIMNK